MSIKLMAVIPMTLHLLPSTVLQRLGAAALCVAILSPIVTYAESGVYEKSLSIQKNIMSPFCPGQILYNCPSEKATQLKDRIEQELLAGKSESTVIAEIQQQYPEAQYAAPPAVGLGLYVWLIPCTFLVVAVAVMALWFRRQLRK